MDLDEELTNELDDLGEMRTFDWRLIDRSIVLHPLVLRAVAGVAVVMVFLLWPDRGQTGLTRLVGTGILLSGATGLWSSLRADRREAVAILGSVAAIAFGGFLLAASQRPEALGRLLGLAILLVAARELISLRSGRSAGAVARSAALVVAGAALLAFPESLFTATALGFGFGWILLGAAALSVTLNPNTPSAAAYDNSRDLLGAWFDDRPKRADSREVLYDKILFEGPDTSRRVIRFVVLMSFASVIASMGVINDSTAVVIGAMLIAPLMTPLMGMAISLVMGWPRRLGRATMMAAAGIALAVLIGVLLGQTVPAIIDTTTNTQILSRTSPTTLDMIVAIAAGAAGAYALSRPDVSDSLPGVAIAISLVPPLTVVGISYSQADWEAGNGALLLYATNMVAILIMGGLTFIVTGVTPISRVTENQRRTRTWGLTLGAAALLIVGALFLNGAQLAQDAFAQDTIEAVVDDWIDQSEVHNVVQSRLDGDRVTAVIIGPSDGAPGAQDLAELLSAEFDRTMTADVRLVVEERDIATSDGS